MVGKPISHLLFTSNIISKVALSLISGFQVLGRWLEKVKLQEEQLHRVETAWKAESCRLSNRLLLPVPPLAFTTWGQTRSTRTWLHLRHKIKRTNRPGCTWAPVQNRLQLYTDTQSLSTDSNRQLWVKKEPNMKQYQERFFLQASTFNLIYFIINVFFNTGVFGWIIFILQFFGNKVIIFPPSIILFSWIFNLYKIYIYFFVIHI